MERKVAATSLILSQSGDCLEESMCPKSESLTWNGLVDSLLWRFHGTCLSHDFLLSVNLYLAETLGFIVHKSENFAYCEQQRNAIYFCTSLGRAQRRFFPAKKERLIIIPRKRKLSKWLSTKKDFIWNSEWHLHLWYHSFWAAEIVEK